MEWCHTERGQSQFVKGDALLNRNFRKDYQNGLRNVMGRPTIRKRRRQRFGIPGIAGIVVICLCLAVTIVALRNGRKPDDSKEAVYTETQESEQPEAESGQSEAESGEPETEEASAQTEEISPEQESSEQEDMRDDAKEADEEMTAQEESEEATEDANDTIGDANVYEVFKKPQQVNAKAAILIDAQSGQVLFEQEAETALPPASTTKLMTALLTIEAAERGELSLDQIVTVDKHARNITPIGGSVLALPIEEGEEVSIRDLLYAVLLKSDCVCCNILAEQVCESVEAFVERMNERAGELGCENTIFLNTHGFKEKGHLTSAHDLALMAAEAMKHSSFYEIVNTAEYTIPETNLHQEREIRNTNWLLGTMWDRNVKQYNKDYEYPYAHGVKTGYTAEAGHCLVSYAKKNDMELICVILGADIDTDENTGYLVQHMYEESIRLYNWGFGAYERGEIIRNEESDLIDLAEKPEEVTEEEVQTVEETQQTEVQEEASADTVQEDGSVAKTVLRVGLGAMVLVLLAGIAFVIYRKFYYFD